MTMTSQQNGCDLMTRRQNLRQWRFTTYTDRLHSISVNAFDFISLTLGLHHCTRPRSITNAHFPRNSKKYTQKRYTATNQSHWAAILFQKYKSIFIRVFAVGSERHKHFETKCVMDVQDHLRSLILGLTSNNSACSLRLLIRDHDQEFCSNPAPFLKYGDFKSKNAKSLLFNAIIQSKFGESSK